MKKSRNYKYNIGDIITDIKYGKLKILEQIGIKSGKSIRKGYKYQCLICGNIDTIAERHLINKHGCNICCPNPHKILIGYNDMWTTNPKLSLLLANPEDGYKYTEFSHDKIDWKCPDCGEVIKNKIIYNVNRAGLSCKKCGDGISYPNKFIFNMLQQLLDVKFENEKTFDWSQQRKYDFYIPQLNILIEAHGNQHYEDEFSRIKSNKKVRTLQEERNNDKLKEELAIKNGIKEDNYIVIDCRESNLEFIKNNILNSELSNIFDLSKINWNICGEFACSSRIKEACNYWEQGIHSTFEIGKIMKLNRHTIQRYVQNGSELKWCDYNAKEESKKGLLEGRKQSSKTIICLNNNKIFNSIIEASNKIGVYDSDISQCCKNKRQFAGANSLTGEYLQWQYYDEYLIKPKKLLSNEEIKSNYKTIKIKVICLNNKNIFESATNAREYYNIQSDHISDCCRGKRNYCGRHPITGEKLKWMYYDDYIESNKEAI